MTRTRQLVVAKAEALFWMGRLHDRSYLPLALAGWLSSPADPGLGRLIGLLSFVWLSTGALMMVTDLLDEEDDKVTAPYFPLACGLVTRREALVAVAGLAVVSLAGLAWAAPTAGRFAGALGITAVAVVLSVVYPFAKPHGALGGLVMCAAMNVGTVVGWFVAGGGSTSGLLAVLAFGCLWEFATNTSTALRDVDGDVKVGHRTVPVRIGPGRAVALIAGLFAALAFPVGYLAFVETDEYLGLPFVGAALVAIVVGYATCKDVVSVPDRGRVARSGDDRVIRWGKWLMTTALLVTFEPLTGLVAVALMQLLWSAGERAHSKRLIEGRLLARMNALRSGPAEPPVDAYEGALQ